MLMRITDGQGLHAPLRLRVLRRVVAVLTNPEGGATAVVSPRGKRKNASAQTAVPANKRAKMEGGEALELGCEMPDTTKQELALLLLAVKGYEGVETVYLSPQALRTVVNMLITTANTQSLIAAASTQSLLLQV